MKRLTDEAWRNNDPWEMCQLGDDCKRKCVNSGVWCKVAIRLRRLAAYEDTGLEPREIKQVQSALDKIPFGRFYEIVQAERDGRCDIRPNPAFAIGDFVRIADAADHQWIGRTGIVVSVSNYQNCPISYRLDIGGGDWLQSMLTLAEAEAALKGAGR